MRKCSYVLLVCLLTWACKKSDTKGSTAPTVNTIATGDPTGTYKAVLIQEFSAGTPGATSTEAIFYKQPTVFKFRTWPIVTPLPTAIGGTVTVNGIPLSYYPTDSTYMDTTGTLSFPPAAWSATGSSLIPAFSYTCTTPDPQLNTSNLPSIIQVSQGLSISMSGTTGYDQVEIGLDDNSGHYYNAMYAGSYSIVSIPKDSMARFVPSTSGLLDVLLIKYSPQNIAGIPVLFATFYTYSKPVTFQ